MGRSCSRAMQRTILPECIASLKTDKVSAKIPRGRSVIAAPVMAFAPLQDGVLSMRFATALQKGPVRQRITLPSVFAKEDATSPLKIQIYPSTFAATKTGEKRPAKIPTHSDTRMTIRLRPSQQTARRTKPSGRNVGAKFEELKPAPTRSTPAKYSQRHQGGKTLTRSKQKG
ncbi:hypothetical protein TcCL_ESM12702 [Trypanosoma cruzi]|nr:hypothetical protein TcCL_ESM12702 [Trypanosoma cruzi]